MNITKICTATLLTSCFLVSSLAQDRPDARTPVERQSIATEKSAETYDRALRPTAKSSGSATDATAVSEVFQSIVIAAGKTVSLDSEMDYSSVSTVAITVQCIICTSAATSLGTSGLVLQARWLVPNGDSYVAVENKAASAFPYTDTGGAIFNVYGSQFRLTLQNKGSQTIAIQQITMFRRIQ